MGRRQEKQSTSFRVCWLSREDKSLAITWEPRTIYRMSWHCRAHCRVWNDMHLFWLIFCQASTAARQSTLEVLVSAVASLCPTEGQRDFLVSLIYLSAISWKFSDRHCVLYAAFLALEHNVHSSLREMSLYAFGYSGSPAACLLSLSFAASLLAKERKTQAKPPSFLSPLSGEDTVMKVPALQSYFWSSSHFEWAPLPDPAQFPSFQ